jgi:hypothetical protein
MTFSFKTRHNHGLEREILFRNFINSRFGWFCEEIGQNTLSEEKRQELQQTFLPFDSKDAQSLLDYLPEDYKDKYLQRLKDTLKPGIPCQERFEADINCYYKDNLMFQGEIKSDMGTYPNITFCVSGYIWAAHANSQASPQKIYLWDLGDDISEWRFLFLEDIPKFTNDWRTGEGLKGSQTPHGLVSKSRLSYAALPVSDLLIWFETIVNHETFF